MNPLSYEPESDFVQMNYVETKEGYSGLAKNNQIEVTTKKLFTLNHMKSIYIWRRNIDKDRKR